MLGMICKCSTKFEICADIDKSRKEVHKRTCLVLTPFSNLRCEGSMQG
jgi:hypothetical protein